MVPVEEARSQDALQEWGDELARYEDLQGALVAARRLGSVAGVRWEIAGRHPGERATAQRSAIARAVAAELASTDRTTGSPKLGLFDHTWQPATVVNRRRGGEHLVERTERNYGLAGRLADSACVRGETGIRWAAVLELEPTDLALAIAAVERDQGALLFSPAPVADAEALLRDLFADDHGVVTSRPLWPLWAARRSKEGDIVLLAHELNDHSGRRAFMLERSRSLTDD